MAKRSARTVWLNNVCTLTVSVVTLIHSFVARDRIRVSHAPAEEAFKTKNKVEPLGTGVDTHTVPLCGARANDLNRHLKSLRNKRKKRRKSSAKRAREKGRCRKK